LPSELMSVIAFVNDDVVALEHSSWAGVLT
jgi:hypothetical protein